MDGPSLKPQESEPIDEKPSALVIDDDRNLCLILRDILEDGGYEVDESQTGKGGLEAISRKSYDVILLDVVMPDLHGIDILKAIKAKRPDTEVILITGHASLDSAVEAINDGAHSYLIKPVDPQHLMLLVRRATEKRRLYIENRRLLEDFHRQATLLEVINEISRAITSTLDFNTLLEILARETKKIISYDCLCVFLFGNNGAEARQIHMHPSGKHLCPDRPLCGFASDDPGSPAAVRRRVSNDLQAETLSEKEIELVKAGFRSRVVLPLIVHGRTIGSLQLASKLPNAFPLPLLAALDKLIDQIAAAIDHARLYQTAQAEAITDPLTHLYNRRQFFEALNNEIQRARRYPSAFSLLILDLDHFKAYNDRFGHIAGDQALVAVASILRRTCRATDVGARYGGDEFAVLLPRTDIKAATVFAKRLRDNVEKARIRSRSHRGAQIITVSVGVASFTSEIDNSDELISRADKALYEAKRRGRNSIRVYDGSSS